MITNKKEEFINRLLVIILIFLIISMFISLIIHTLFFMDKFSFEIGFVPYSIYKFSLSGLLSLFICDSFYNIYSKRKFFQISITIIINILLFVNIFWLFFIINRCTKNDYLTLLIYIILIFFFNFLKLYNNLFVKIVLILLFPLTHFLYHLATI